MLRVRVALNVPRTIPRAIVYAEAVAAALKGNPAFPSPTPPLASFEADLADLGAWQVRTLTHTFGAAAERDARFAAVMGDLDVRRRGGRRGPRTSSRGRRRPARRTTGSSRATGSSG
jgi:hypothetical protein